MRLLLSPFSFSLLHNRLLSWYEKDFCSCFFYSAWTTCKSSICLYYWYGCHNKQNRNYTYGCSLFHDYFRIYWCDFLCYCFDREPKYSFKIKDLFVSMKKLFSVSYVLTINKIMITFLQCFEAILVPIVLVKSGLSKDNALVSMEF